MHPFRVGDSLSKSLGGTAVGNINENWRMEDRVGTVADTTGLPLEEKCTYGNTRTRGQSLADPSDLPLSPEFDKYFAVCAGND